MRILPEIKYTCSYLCVRLSFAGYFLSINISFGFAICLLLYFPSPRLDLSNSLCVRMCVYVCGWPIYDWQAWINTTFAGAYGTVYRALDNDTGRYVAIKKVRVPLTENGVSASTLREIALLKQLNKYDHANIVRWVRRERVHSVRVCGCTCARGVCVCVCLSWWRLDWTIC